MARAKTDKKKTETNTASEWAVDWENFAQLAPFRAEWQRLEHQDRLPQVILFQGLDAFSVSAHAQAALGTHYCATQSGCGHCHQCQQIKEFKHPEVLWLGYDEGGIKVDDCPTILEWVGLHAETSSVQGGPSLKRTVVLGAIERMTEQAANKLLKTIEEPESHCRFILWTTKPQAILDTIRSRTFHWQVSVIPRENASNPAEWLQLAPAAQQVLFAKNLSDRLKQAEKLAKESNLGIEQIQVLIEQVLNNCYREALGVQTGSSQGQNHVVQFTWRHEWRKILSETRRRWQANRRTGLNVNLFADALALVTARVP